MASEKQWPREAPGFDRNHGRSMADLQWAVSICEHYGTRPYLE